MSLFSKLKTCSIDAKEVHLHWVWKDLGPTCGTPHQACSMLPQPFLGSQLGTLQQQISTGIHSIVLLNYSYLKKNWHTFWKSETKRVWACWPFGSSNSNTILHVLCRGIHRCPSLASHSIFWCYFHWITVLGRYIPPKQQWLEANLYVLIFWCARALGLMPPPAKTKFSLPWILSADA